VIYRPLSELTLDPKNPRTHSLKQVRQIARQHPDLWHQRAGPGRCQAQGDSPVTAAF
jgi:hypothetical protein